MVLHNSTDNYTSATYIEGNFSDSVSYYRSTVVNADMLSVLNKKKKKWKYKNKDYSLHNKNCLKQSYEGLKKGTLPDGTNFGDFVGYKAIISHPNQFESLMSDYFINESIIKSGARTQAKNNKDKKYLLAFRYPRGRKYAAMLGV